MDLRKNHKSAMTGIVTGDDWEKALQDPQSPLYKLLFAKLTHEVAAEACLQKVLEYWLQKMQLEDKHERHQLWMVGEEEARLVEKRIFGDGASEVAKPVIPDNANELSDFKHNLTESASQLQKTIHDLQQQISQCDQNLNDVSQRFADRQTQQVAHYTQQLIETLPALQLPAGVTIPAPPAPHEHASHHEAWQHFTKHLEEAATQLSPKQLFEGNPALLEKPAKAIASFGDVMAELRLKATLLGRTDKFATHCHAFNKHNPHMCLPKHSEADVQDIEAAQGCLRDKLNKTTQLKIAEKSLSATQDTLKTLESTPNHHPTRSH